MQCCRRWQQTCAGGFQPPSVGRSSSNPRRAIHPQRGDWKSPARVQAGERPGLNVMGGCLEVRTLFLGLRWQSAAATPLWLSAERPLRAVKGTLLSPISRPAQTFGTGDKSVPLTTAAQDAKAAWRFASRRSPRRHGLSKVPCGVASPLFVQQSTVLFVVRSVN